MSQSHCTIEDRKSFSTYASELKRLMKYADRDDVTGHMRKQYEAIAAIYGMLQKKRKHTDTTELMVEINAIINDYVEIEPQQPNAITVSPHFDISAIDFDLLRREFAKTRRKNLLMRDLDEAIRRQLDKMVFVNPKRIDYYERYREIIQNYNGEQDRATIEKTFLDLMDLADRMSREEQRYAREGFASDEELSLYDMLFRDDLSKNDIKKLKTAASNLLQKIKGKISELDHWTDKHICDLEAGEQMITERGSMSWMSPNMKMETTSNGGCSLEDRKRLNVIPGITCLWQISGRSDIPFSRQVELDKEYIHSRSFWKDVLILLKTIPAILSGRGAY